MGRGTEGKRTGKEDVRERLVHSIYTLVHDESEWPNLFSIMDEFFMHANEAGRTSDLDFVISSLFLHVERANLLLEKISEMHLKNSHADRVMNHIPMGIVLISPQAKILSLNFRATALLDHIQATHRDGVLQFRDKPQQREFWRVLDEVASGKAHGAPLKMGELNLWISHYGEGTNAQLAVYLGHQTFRRNISIEQLMSAYMLTEKEAQLAARLCDGHTDLDETAENMGISISTARSHLKKVFSKTGAKRQAELVKMLLVNPILALHKGTPAMQRKTRAGRETLLIRLPSGRTISYAEYGDPKGKPVLFCHAVSGCRLMLPSDTSLLNGTGIRLIVPDRAGYGFSTRANGNSMKQWLEDMELFLPQVDAPACCVIGHSAGGAHAMSLAITYPYMVNKLCLISSVAPLRNIADVKQLLPINRLVIHLARSNPDAAREFLKLSLRSALNKTDSYFKLITNSPRDLDMEVMDNAGLRKHLLDAFSETTRQGIGHLVDELMYISTCWQVNPRQINCPVEIWHGMEDMHAPFSLMEKFSSRLPQCTQTNWIDGSGHYMLFKHWPQIVEGLCKAKRKAKR